MEMDGKVGIESEIECFIVACALNNTQEVKEFILNYGVDAAKVNLADGSNGFLCACQENSLEAVILIADAGYDLDFKNVFGATGFMKACYYKRYDIIDYLLQLSVNINIQDNAGRSALMEGTSSSLFIFGSFNHHTTQTTTHLFPRPYQPSVHDRQRWSGEHLAALQCRYRIGRREW